MTTKHFAALVGLLLAVSSTLGQAQDTLPVLAPVPVAAPPTNGTSEGPALPLAEVPDRAPRVFSVDAEFVLWLYGTQRDKLINASTSPLGTTGNIILGTDKDAERDAGLLAGSRLTFGYWLMADNPWIPGGIRDLGVAATFMFIAQTSSDFSNDRQPTLIRPFFDLNNRQESGFVVAMPGVSTGNLTAHAQADLWGAEVNVWKNVYCNYPGTSCTVDILGGFRFLSADEQVRLASTSFFNPSIAASSPFAGFAGDRLDVLDSFTTHNRFYGGQIGIDTKSWILERLCFEVAFKLALGVTTEDLNIEGDQIRRLPNGTTIASNGGLFALASNIGSFSRDKFTPIPELSFKLATPITNQLTLSVGFSALYWDRVLRAGLQIQRELDITQIPNFPGAASAVPTGLGSPGVPFRQSDLYVMGLSLGLEYKW
jgi:hypothetical protein